MVTQSLPNRVPAEHVDPVVKGFGAPHLEHRCPANRRMRPLAAILRMTGGLEDAERQVAPHLADDPVLLPGAMSGPPDRKSSKIRPRSPVLSLELSFRFEWRTVPRR